MTTTQRDFINLSVCTDCYYCHHYGDIGDVYSLDDADAVETHLHRNAVVTDALAALGPDVVDNCDSETGRGIDGFSSTACDCCGSSLGGKRYRLAAFTH